eukprot:4098797-Alexandrium_andersonii.AAC.1
MEIEVGISIERFFFATTRKRDEYFSDYVNKKTIELFELESALKLQLPPGLVVAVLRRNAGLNEAQRA